MGSLGKQITYECIRPAASALPILYSLPHSGRDYPDDFNSCQPLEILRKAEDAFVDVLLESAPANGVTVLKALFPRAYLDVNRSLDDLDPLLMPPDASIKPGPKSQMGIGLVRRVVTPEYPIYDRILTLGEIKHRIETYYTPYHAALSGTLKDLQSRHNKVLFIDWHSMKSVGNAATPDGEGARRADFVISDLNGASCDAAIVEAVKRVLEKRGFQVSINHPYSGGATLQRYSAPEDGIHGLQIEINRALYLNEDHVTLKEGVDELSAILSSLVPVLAGWVSEARS